MLAIRKWTLATTDDLTPSGPALPVRAFGTRNLAR